jgi:acetyltransferase-like isoleucine patch superfamily enzyme
MVELGQIGHLVIKDVKNMGGSPRRRLINLLSGMLGDSYSMQYLRGRLLKFGGAQIAVGVRIRGPIHVDELKKLSIGPGSFLNCEVYLDNTGAEIRIGENVIVGFRVSMTTSNHDMETREIISKPITIGDWVWIGACSTILPGVTIGKGAVVAGGAVVASDVMPYTVVGGVPARMIKKLDLPKQKIAL